MPVATLHRRTNSAVDDEVEVRGSLALFEDPITWFVHLQLGLLDQILSLSITILAEPSNLLKNVMDGLEVRYTPKLRLFLVLQYLLNLTLA